MGALLIVSVIPGPLVVILPPERVAFGACSVSTVCTSTPRSNLDDEVEQEMFKSGAERRRS